MTTQITKISIDNKDRFAVSIPYALKDALKKAIPSAKFDGTTKQWHVGSRSIKKLEAFLAEHAQEKAESDAKKAAFAEKLASMHKLTGHTYEIREELKSRFNAIYHDKAWYVEDYLYCEAQAFVNSCTEEFKAQKVIESQQVDADSTAVEIVKALKSVDGQFKFNGESKYLGGNEAVEKLIKEAGIHDAHNIILTIYRQLDKELAFADENDCEFSFTSSYFDDEYAVEFLTAFNLFVDYKINFHTGMIEDRAAQIEQEKQAKEAAKNADKALIDEAVERLGREKVFELLDGNMFCGKGANADLANQTINTGSFFDDDYRNIIIEAIEDDKREPDLVSDESSFDDDQDYEAEKSEANRIDSMFERGTHSANITKQEQFNEYLELNNIKPEISQKGIFFPISVEHINLNQYHGDARSFGYDFDDGQCTVVTYEQVIGILAEDTIAMFAECEEIKKYMKKPHHSMLDIIQSDAVCDRKNAELLIRYDSEYFYKDDTGFFFITEYYCKGEPQRVSNETAEIYREVNKEYQRQIKKHNSIMKAALENIKLLKTTLDD